jgi:hypothetical protein
MSYVIRVGKEGFTKQEILNALRNSFPYKIGHLTDADYPLMVEYMKISWKNFPKDKYIHETSPDRWLRKGELECHAYAIWSIVNNDDPPWISKDDLEGLKKCIRKKTVK